MAITSQIIDYRDGETPLSGVMFSNSATPERRPGVLVVHGGAGLDDHALKRAESIAELGFTVLACDMYGSEVRGNRERIMALLNDFRGNPAQLCQRAQAAINLLASHPQVERGLAAVGYCFGGMTVLELARSGAGLAGVVSVHGSLATTRLAQPGSVKAKILVCHGALDPHVPMSHVSAFIDEMNHAGADWQLDIYGGALHGFTHDSGPALPGVAYNATADARSAAAIRTFFTELFGPV